jgi:hypothetical protein
MKKLFEIEKKRNDTTFVETCMCNPLRTKTIFVVSHSYLMQSGIDILDTQDHLSITVESQEDFDFAQNVWTLQVAVCGGKLILKKLFDGVLKPKKNMPPDELTTAPGTISQHDPECNKYDKTAKNTDISIAQSKLVSVFSKRSAAEESETLSMKKKQKFFQRNKVKKNMNYQAKSFNESLCFDIFVSRHGNSCNNIQEEHEYGTKKSDPSLSSYGVWSLSPQTTPTKRPVKLQELAKTRNKLNASVFTSACIRTMQTALMIYGNEPERHNSLVLIVAPFLKEIGDFSGNMPEDIPVQMDKLTSWIYAHKTSGDISQNLAVTIYVAHQNNTPDTLIYTYGDGILRKEDTVEYDEQHLTFYPDGLLKFSEWITQRETSATISNNTRTQSDNLGYTTESKAPPGSIINTSRTELGGRKNSVYSRRLTRKKNKKRRRQRKPFLSRKYISNT